MRHEYRAIVETTNGETVHLSGKEMADLSDLLFLLSGAKPIPPEAPDPEPDTADAVDLADVLGDLNNALFK
ncbi:hypothetical protein [Prochlorothrix hollandica]|uniref:hypothetical protein n=1 Tax=Prochlorothrix hollandica TaxID=1223 RepID=UPI0003498BAD|nr:hypothetical protein [Prochlorothrix hollandica]